MRKVLLSIIVLISGIAFDSSGSQTKFSDIPADSIIWQNYERYKETSIKNRLFKHADIVPLIQKHVDSKIFKSEILGNSVQGRSINHLTFGKGKTKVLLWSQMHGDESTATMALFDIFNFLSANDENNNYRKLIAENLELHFIPMLNPDGAEVWKRRGALDIDINRDARALNTPEGRILTDLSKKIKPQFGFNLHDQSMLYSAGPTKNQATISFLSPAYNYQKDMNAVRENATKLIVKMNGSLQKYIPGKVAKYDDAHDPRCFGDTFQGNGISTILIESGGYPNDPEKQYIRKLNFLAILSALNSIATKSYEKATVKEYDAIPENNRSLYDLIIRNVEIAKGDVKFRTNLGINRSQILNADKKSMSYRGYIEELGDMEKSFGYVEVNAALLTTATGKVKVMTKDAWEKLTTAEEVELIKQGYLFVNFSDGKSSSGPVKNRLLNLSNTTDNIQPVGLGQPANFILMDKNQPVYAVINGFLIDLKKDITTLVNTYGY